MSKTKVATTRRSRKKKAAAPAAQKPTNGAGADKLAETLQRIIRLNPQASPRAVLMATAEAVGREKDGTQAGDPDLPETRKQIRVLLEQQQPKELWAILGELEALISRRLRPVERHVYHHKHDIEAAVLAEHETKESKPEFWRCRPIGDLLVAALGSAPDPDRDSICEPDNDGREFPVYALEDIADQLLAIAARIDGTEQLGSIDESELLRLVVHLAKRVRASAVFYQKLSEARQELWLKNLIDEVQDEAKSDDSDKADEADAPSAEATS